MQPKMGGKSHLKLNIGERPIANKYREGKMKRTLKRELKVREIVKRETIGASIGCAVISRSMSSRAVHSAVLAQVNISLVRWKNLRGR